MSRLPIAKVMFGLNSVALHFVQPRELCRARNRALELPRVGHLREADLNVRYLRAIERAANNARDNAELESAELEELIEEGVAPCDGGITPGGCH